ncbi:MAG: CpsD/CapB family tyrosine-protein kinase, partial [Xanthomonadales bacterium]|nr:CpsD/CapB family tyrosine-protein kinase [Xanthomonadales bacterium]
KRVLLIDSDLRNPSLHRTLGLDNSKGLSTCLSGGAKPAECIHPAQVANLFLLPSGPLPPSPAELLSGPRMMSLLAQASERYDHVILDAPPVLGLADAPILGSISKGTLFVVEAGKTRVSIAQTAIKRLFGARARLLGAVLTKFDPKNAGYGYGYGSGAYAYLGYDYYGAGSGAPARRLGRG